MSIILQARQIGLDAYRQSPAAPQETAVKQAIDTALLHVAQEVHELALMALSGYDLVRRTTEPHAIPGGGSNIANAITLLRPVALRLEQLDIHMSILKSMADAAEATHAHELGDDRGDD